MLPAFFLFLWTGQKGLLAAYGLDILAASLVHVAAKHEA